MLDRIAAAFEHQDYRTAAQLIRQMEQEQPQDPWVLFYRGRLQEVAGQLESAEKTYQQVLKTTTQVRLTNLSRQGIQRVQKIEQEQIKRAIDQAHSNPTSQQPACLVLEPLTPEAKLQAAPRFGRLMHLDPYTARLHLPSRNWRFYRTGTLGELQVYTQTLAEIGVPAFCVALSQIETIPLFRGQSLSLEGNGNPAQVICQNGEDQPGTLTFAWEEVQLWVEGNLPIFESVVDRALWGMGTVRKEKTQDYAHVVDLHLPERGCIVRLCDRTYDFSHLPLAPSADRLSPGQESSKLPQTHHQKWQQILGFLHQYLPQVETLTAFTSFAETVLDQDIFLEQVKPHLDLFRREESPWDNAFHLYSTLAFIRQFRHD